MFAGGGTLGKGVTNWRIRDHGSTQRGWDGYLSNSRPSLHAGIGWSLSNRRLSSSLCCSKNVGHFPVGLSAGCRFRIVGWRVAFRMQVDQGAGGLFQMTAGWPGHQGSFLGCRLAWLSGAVFGMQGGLGARGSFFG